MSKIWVVTKEVNAYYQEEEGYFITAFDHKPTAEELSPWFDEKYSTYLIETGGGRIKFEFVWYYLKEIESGQF